MMQLITGIWTTQIVYGAARYSLADHLRDRALTAQEIADAEGLDRRSTLRFLRACESLGLVRTDGLRYSSTDLLETLRKGEAGSLRGFAQVMGAPGHWLPWGRFTEALRTGDRQTVPALGTEIFEYYRSNSDEAAAFMEAMSGLTAPVSTEVARLLHTSGHRRVIDVGGATGTLIFSILHANPDLQGVVFDQPDVVPSAALAAREAGLSSRVEIAAGDFFKAIPEGDLYLLRYILHDWDDDSCLKILRNCRKAAQAGTRLAIIEHLLEPAAGSPFTHLMDLNMMVLLPGRERSLEEYQSLLSSAGFGEISVTRTETSMVILTTGIV
jgi:hypothetical protein